MSKSTKKLVKEYIDNCTIHGVPRLVKSKNTLLRIFWFLLIISSLGGCSFFILSSTMDYLNYDVISNFNVHNSVPMELPTVTICNMNSYKHKMNYTIDQMLIKCRVENTNCNSSHFEKKIISSYTCYSFNNGKIPFDDNNVIATTARQGFLYGISLRLFAGLQNETDLYINGFLVFIHNRTELPLIEQALQVSGGLYSRIMITKEITERLERPYNDCYKDIKSTDSLLVKRILESGYEYNQQTCFSLYLKKLQTEICQCSIPYEYEVENMPSCQSVSNYSSCMRKVYEEAYKQEFKTEGLKACPNKCDSINLNLHLSFSLYPTERQCNYLVRKLKEVNTLVDGYSKDDLKNSLVYIRIFFDNLNYRIKYQIPKIYLFNLVSAVGGTLGLCLGMSFLSFFELFELIYHIFQTKFG